MGGEPIKSRSVLHAHIHAEDSVIYLIGGIVCVCGDGGREGV